MGRPSPGPLHFLLPGYPTRVYTTTRVLQKQEKGDRGRERKVQDHLPKIFTTAFERFRFAIVTSYNKKE
jgi:hypothetical protein